MRLSQANKFHVKPASGCEKSREKNVQSQSLVGGCFQTSKLTRVTGSKRVREEGQEMTLEL